MIGLPVAGCQFPVAGTFKVLGFRFQVLGSEFTAMTLRRKGSWLQVLVQGFKFQVLGYQLPVARCQYLQGFRF